MFTVTIEKRHILALSVIAAKADVRYYLNGLCIETGPTESRVIACDGHRLGVIRGQAPEYGAQGFGESQQVIIPIDAFKGIKKAKKGEADSVVISVNAPDYQIQDGDTIRAGKLVDGKFPDWRRVCDVRDLSNVPQQFQPGYIGDFGRVSGILGNKSEYVGIAHNGEVKDAEGNVTHSDGAAIVTVPGCPEFFAVVMPWRIDKTDIATAAPHWVMDNLQAQPVELQAAA